MSNVLIIHSGDVTDSLVATSLVRYFLKRNLKVHAALDNKLCDILSFANGLNLVPVTEFKPKSHYEIAINLSPCVFCADLISRASAESKFGYGITPLRDSLFFYNQGAYYHYLQGIR